MAVLMLTFFVSAVLLIFAVIGFALVGGRKEWEHVNRLTLIPFMNDLEVDSEESSTTIKDVEET
jgi:hypothetical protein